MRNAIMLFSPRALLCVYIIHVAAYFLVGGMCSPAEGHNQRAGLLSPQHKIVKSEVNNTVVSHEAARLRN